MRRPIYLALAGALLLAGCSANRNPLEVSRSACPAVAVLQHAGSVTLFSPETSRNADAIDVTATITNLRSNCTETAGQIISEARFDVVAQRTNAAGAREVVLPYFASVVRAGDQLLSKQLGSVRLVFEEGSLSATASATARADISEAAATLPEEINREIDKRREPGDPDAAIDPLSLPGVAEAVRNASFELIVGFQMDDPALAYNIGK